MITPGMLDQIKFELLYLIKQNKAIYQINDMGSLVDKGARAQAWEAIADKLNYKYNIHQDVSWFKHVFKLLKDSYMRKRRENKAAMLQGVKLRENTWKFYDSMKFLEFWLSAKEGCPPIEEFVDDGMMPNTLAPSPLSMTDVKTESEESLQFNEDMGKYDPEEFNQEVLDVDTCSSSKFHRKRKADSPLENVEREHNISESMFPVSDLMPSSSKPARSHAYQDDKFDLTARMVASLRDVEHYNPHAVAVFLADVECRVSKFKCDLLKPA